MANVDKCQLAMMLGVQSGEIDDLVLAGIIEPATSQPEASLRFDTDAEKIAALLNMTPTERRAAGVKDNRSGTHSRPVRLNMSNERE